MDIYRRREEIILSENIGEKVRKQKESYLKVDRKLVSCDKPVEIDVDSISDLPDGRIVIHKDGGRFECMFKKGTTDRLWVFPSASRARPNCRAKVPLFERWSYYGVLEDSILCVSDPMYYDYPNLDCAWFWGNESISYRETLAYIVERITDFCGIKKQNVIFMGVSAGGTTALHTAAIFNEGTAISINPQLNFEYEKRNNRIAKFKENTGIDITKEDTFGRNKLYEKLLNSPNVKFLIANNVYSNEDIKEHLIYFCDKIGFSPKYGLSNFKNINFWLYDAEAPNPHNAFDDKNLIFILEYLSKIKSDKLEDYNRLYQLFSSIWSSKYTNIIYSDLKNEELLPEVLKNGRLIKEKRISNINIDASDNKYNRFYYDGFISGNIYYLRFKVKNESCSRNYTAGIYNWNKKDFVCKYTFKENIENSLVFFCGEKNSEFLLYSGLYGNADSQKFDIDYLEVYRVEGINKEVYKHFLANPNSQEARFDIRVNNTSGLVIENLSDALFDVQAPGWINKEGKGYVITSNKGYARFSLKSLENGKIKFDFRGIDLKQNGHRILVWVDYLCIRVGEKALIDSVVPCSHDDSIHFERFIEKGEEIIIVLKWRNHFS